MKKKYSKEHVLLLILIYYFKSILSIKDIETILTPLREKYFPEEGPLSLSEVYREICEIEKSRIEPMKASVKEAYEKSGQAFRNIPEGEDRDELRLFAFLCSLSFDVYLKKMMIENLIDELASKKEE